MQLVKRELKVLKEVYEKVLDIPSGSSVRIAIANYLYKRIAEVEKKVKRPTTKV